MQINRWLHLSSSLWGISLRCTLFTKRRPEKFIYQVASGEFPFTALCLQKEDLKNFLFIVTNNFIVLTVQWFVKYFFCSEFPNILDTASKKREEEQRQLQNVLRFTQTQKVCFFLKIWDQLFQKFLLSYNWYYYCRYSI